jgi:hypothetical protein
LTLKVPIKGQTKIGAIYGYRDPATGKWLYVGSVQNFEKLQRRHNVHLKGDGLLSRYLRFFPLKHEPKPIEIRRVEFADVATLFWVENGYIEVFKTWREFGGFNKMSPVGPFDHADLGRIGGRACGKSKARRCGTPEAKEWSARGGRKSGPIRSAAKTKAARKNRLKPWHKHFHVDRNIFCPICPWCQKDNAR